MKRIFLTLIIALFTIGLIAQASDLIIESKTQSYDEKDNKIKFDGDVKVGQIKTCLAIKGKEQQGPKAAALDLFEIIKEL